MIEAIKYHGRWHIAQLRDAEAYGPRAAEFAQGRAVWSDVETTAWICCEGEERARVPLEAGSE